MFIDIFNFWDSVMFNYGKMVGYVVVVGLGYWNDFDMFEVGNMLGIGLFFDEMKVYLGFWVLMVVFFVVGNDVCSVLVEVIVLLMNLCVFVID